MNELDKDIATGRAVECLVLAVYGSSRAQAGRPLSLHSRHQQTNVERSQRVDCVIHRPTQQTFGQL
jgi:hypothetical protein